MGEAEQPATGDQTSLGGEVQRRPARLRQRRFVAVAHHRQEFGLGESASCRPQRREHVSGQARPVAFEVDLVAGQHLLEQVVDGRRAAQIGDHRPEREVVAVLAQLVEHHAQEPRVAGRLRTHQRVQMLGVEALRITGEEPNGERSPLVGIERREFQQGPTAMLELCSRTRSAGRHDQPDTRGDLGRQPSQVGCSVDVVEPIDTVDHDDRRTCRGGERLAEHAAQGGGILGRVARHPVGGRRGVELGHDATDHRPVVGGIAVGLDVVHDDVGVGVGRRPGVCPVRHERRTRRSPTGR